MQNRKKTGIEKTKNRGEQIAHVPNRFGFCRGQTGTVANRFWFCRGQTGTVANRLWASPGPPLGLGPGPPLGLPWALGLP